MSKNINGVTTFEENKLTKTNQTNRSRQYGLNKFSKHQQLHPSAAAGSSSVATNNNNNRNYKKQTSRPTQQRNKSFNKINKTGSQGDDDVDVESLLTPRSGGKHNKRRVVTDDLIKFTFESSRTNYYDNIGGGRPYARGKQQYKRNGGGSNFNKNQFLQATSQAILRSGKDYSIHLADSDLMFEWNEIEKLNVWSVEIPSCPICLHPTTASRITQCGHIYCWSCILRFLHQSDKQWANCPVCTEPVHINDLRSVGICKDEDHQIQSTIKMKLMKRTSDSATPLPAVVDDCSNYDDGRINPLYCKDKKLRNYRYLVATPDQILEDIINDDLKQLEFELAIEDDVLEKPFVEMALTACRERKKAMVALIAKRDAKLKSKQTPAVTENHRNGSGVAGSDDVTAASVTSLCDDVKNMNVCTTTTTATDIKCGEDINKNATTTDSTGGGGKATKYFYFYQADDGQHIYLSQLNMKCLTHQYGDYEKLPLNIEAKIVQIDQFTMDQTTRKQHKYMAHLPLSLKFLVAELDLKPPIVSEDTLQFFKKSIDTRIEQRRQRVREEKKITRRSKLEALRRQNKYPPPRYQLNNNQQFPDISNYQLQNEGSSQQGGSHSVLFKPSSTSYTNDEPSQSTSAHVQPVQLSSSVESTSSYQHQASFAQMLKSASPPSNTGTEISKWKRQQPTWPAATSTTGQLQQVGADVDDFDPDYQPPPSYQSSFGDALWADFPTTATTASAGKSTDGRKKKNKKCRNKKKVLFSTSNNTPL